MYDVWEQCVCEGGCDIVGRTKKKKKQHEHVGYGTLLIYGVFSLHIGLAHVEMSE